MELLARLPNSGVCQMQTFTFLNLPDQGVYRLSLEQQAKGRRRCGFNHSLDSAWRIVSSITPADRHPDHEAIYRLVDEAIRQIDFSAGRFSNIRSGLIWKGPYPLGLGGPTISRARAASTLRGAQERKRKAIDVYVSQLAGFCRRGFIDQFIGGL